MIALLASFLISTNATARELVMNCRTMIPANVELSGRIILRNRKGIPQAEHDYVLSRSDSVTRLSIDGQNQTIRQSGNQAIDRRIRAVAQSRHND